MANLSPETIEHWKACGGKYCPLNRNICTDECGLWMGNGCAVVRIGEALDDIAETLNAIEIKQ